MTNYTADIEFTNTMVFVTITADETMTEDEAIAAARDEVGTSEFPASIGGEPGVWCFGFSGGDLYN